MAQCLRCNNTQINRFKSHSLVLVQHSRELCEVSRILAGTRHSTSVLHSICCVCVWQCSCARASYHCCSKQSHRNHRLESSGLWNWCLFWDKLAPEIGQWRKFGNSLCRMLMRQHSRTFHPPHRSNRIWRCWSPAKSRSITLNSYTKCAKSRILPWLHRFRAGTRNYCQIHRAVRYEEA